MGIEGQYDHADKATTYAEESGARIESDEGRKFIYQQISEQPRTSRLLDVGCGSGIDLSRYFEMGFTHLFGIDPSHKSIHEARNVLGDKVELQEGTFEHIPYKDGSFDIVTSRFALHYAIDIQKSLEEVARVLKQGGKFIAVVSHPHADAQEQKDSNGNITTTLFNGRVTISYPSHELDEYFSEQFSKDFVLETTYEYCGKEADRSVNGQPNALAISAKKK